MNPVRKIFGLLLASLVLASCGGGGGSDGGAFTPAPLKDSTLTISATATTLPVNVWDYMPTQYGNPAQSEVTITWRRADGSMISGQSMQASIAPVSVAAMSCVVDENCDDGNQLFAGLPLEGTNGVATVFVNAGRTAGTATLTVTAQDPDTGNTISATMKFTVKAGTGPMPASIDITPSPAGIYLPGSGGRSTSSVRATVLDGAGQLVPDPVSGNSGTDNIQFEILGDAGDARLSTNSASGPVSGRKVTGQTVRGTAEAAFQAAENTPQGPVQIRVTVDRADNNVSNGLQDPVSVTTSVIVSDGKLHSLTLTSPLFAPALPGITINSISDEVDTDDVDHIPADPDATLSLVITALATDRQGNPVLPGTAIRFGLVDEPVGRPGTPEDNQFLISGGDGNPQEGGNLFTAPSGRFTTAGGGAGPGDALLVFGKAVQGQADLESAVTVQRVNSATSMNVQPRFNLNNTTGSSVDGGSILPYLVGRAMHGNITATATTDEKGVAHATLTYTVNNVFHPVAVWAQGDGIDRITNGPRRVTDIGTMAYPAVAPASIVVYPNPLLGNTTQEVTACVHDALGIPLRGVEVGFRFELPSGSGSVDGSNGSGVLGSLTGLDGCVTGEVVTQGLPVTGPGGNSGQLLLSALGATAEPIDFVVQVSALRASPGSVSLGCIGTETNDIRITALGTDGSPLAGVDVVASCTAPAGATLTVAPGSATTGANGSTTFRVTSKDFADSNEQPRGDGECTFTSTASARSVTVPFRVFLGSPPLDCAVP